MERATAIYLIKTRYHLEGLGGEVCGDITNHLSPVKAG